MLTYYFNFLQHYRSLKKLTLSQNYPQEICKVRASGGNLRAPKRKIAALRGLRGVYLCGRIDLTGVLE